MKYNEEEMKLYKAFIRKTSTQPGQEVVMISPFQHILNQIANSLMLQHENIWGPCYGISPRDFNSLQHNQRHNFIEKVINRHIQILEHEMLFTNDFILEKFSGFNMLSSILTLSIPDYDFSQILK